MKIQIAVITFNRKDIVTMMAKSFYASEISFPYDLRVYDDASDQYDENYLRDIFPDATAITRQSHNIGPDQMMYNVYQDFLESENDLFFAADSDLIFSKGWLEKGIELLPYTDGVLSLFNTPHHAGMCVGNGLLEKRSLGSAGTFFTKEITKIVIKEALPNDGSGIDCKWSIVLQNKGIRFFSTNQSYVQHIGIDGYHSKMNRFDYGDNFKVDSEVNGQILNDILEKLGSPYNVEKQNHIRKSFAVFPFEHIEKGSRILIYGAGNYGKDYIRQVEATDFCTITAVVDNNTGIKEVLGIKVIVPEEIKNMEFDRIVLALADTGVLTDIIDRLKRIGISEDKVVFKTGKKEIEL